ncbi:type V CRISPR-associated protein Cas12a/Cpf1, partial [Patescibacteria group bacterium]|nr:type V CRISPR-associated protein Cas12a/Cpf1 [Patescibacteria group bacterium]
NRMLTQKQIDAYNLIIGGMTIQEGERKIQGLNEYINLYNQKQNKKNKMPKLKQLYKQILSDRESVSFLPDEFVDDAEETASQKVLNTIEEYYQANLISFRPGDKDETENVLEKTKELLSSLKDYDLNKIYFRNDKAITDISQALFGDWNIIKAALEFSFLQTLKISKKGLSKKQKIEKENYLKQSHFSIAEIESALLTYKDKVEILSDFQEDTKPVANYFHTNFKTEKKEESDKEFDIIANIQAKYSCIKGILNTKYSKEKRLYQDKKTIGDIKAFLDSLMELLHFVKPLSLPSDSPLEKDEIFYGQFQTWYDQLQHLIPLYNKVRNYATQKPYSVEKFKLNFENSTLLAGWDLNKEPDNTSILLRKNGRYYLAIMDKEHNGALKNIPNANEEEIYEKMVYKLLPGANKMLPKVFFSESRIDYFAPPEKLRRNYKKETHKKGGNFSLKDCHALIDFFKASIAKHEDWNQFGFKFSDTASYKDLSGFYREVEQQGYKITFQNISENYINQLVDEGKLYLFQIYNKDFSKYSKGKPNLHTIYWKALFDPENLKNVVYKLNGQAELFYRKKSIDAENRVVHVANQPIDNKNPNNEKKQSVFEYDIVKDRRFTADKFQFHVPITLNFNATGNDYINPNVLKNLKNNPKVNIIGIDRGERHLVYVTLINQQGDILQQKSLNTVVNKKHNIKTDYHHLLGQRENERDKARKEWETIETIKELKEGYVSQIVHEISEMMVKHNAIVVMEDLNFGFKRGRFKVEKQIYQKLEKKLIDKLNYLVFK